MNSTMILAEYVWSEIVRNVVQRTTWKPRPFYFEKDFCVHEKGQKIIPGWEVTQTGEQDSSPALQEIQDGLYACFGGNDR